MSDLEIEDTAPAPPRKNPSVAEFMAQHERGVCHICGAPARNPKAFTCEEHAPAKKAKAKAKEFFGTKESATDTDRTASAPKATTAPRKGRQPSLKGEIQTFYEVVGEMVGYAAPRVGQAITANAAAAATAWDAKAKSNATIYKFWANAADVSGWGAIVFAHTPILFAVRDEVRDRAVIRQIAHEAAEQGHDPGGAVQMVMTQAAQANMSVFEYTQAMAQAFAGAADNGAPAADQSA